MSQATEQDFDFDLSQDAIPPHIPQADGDHASNTPIRARNVLPPPTCAHSMVGQTMAKFAKLSTQANTAVQLPGAMPAQAEAPATPTPASSCLRTRSEKSLPSLDKGKGRASGAATPLPTPAPKDVPMAHAPVQGPLPGVIGSLQSLTISETSLKSNLPAIRADIQLLGTTIQHLLRTQASDRAESHTTLTSLLAATESVNEHLAQAGLLQGQPTEQLQTLEARIDSLAHAVERNETALNTEFTTFQDHHDELVEDYSRLSRSLASVINTLAELTRDVRNLAPPPPAAVPSIPHAPLADTPAAPVTTQAAPVPTRAAPPFAQAALPAPNPARGGPRFRPLRTPAIIRPASTQAMQVPEATHEAPGPQPRPLRRRQLDTGSNTAAARAKHPHLDTQAAMAAAAPAPAPVAGPSTAPAASGSWGTRVRFGSIDWALDAVTLRQQVYTAALPVWEADFALFACLNGVEFDYSDNTYVFLAFPARDDAQAFIDLWFANRVKSVAYARAQAHVV